MTQSTTAPWFKQKWLLFVLSVPFASVILSSIMVTVAVVGRDSLVNDNYYKYGLEINQTIEQDKLAQELNLAPLISINSDGDVHLQVKSEQMPTQPFLTLKLVHPTLGDQDIVVRLLPTENSFSGHVPAGLTGRWYLDLYAHDESWRIREQATLPAEQFELKP